MNLAEDAWPILVVGGMTALILAVAFRQTGKRGLAVGAGVIVALTLLGWLAEYLIVTERERVEMTFATAVGHLENNRDAELLAMIAADANELRQLANQYLPQFDKAEVAFSDLKIDISDSVEPPLATVNFLGRITVTGDFTGQGLPYTSIGPLPFTLRLRKQGGDWMLIGFHWNQMPMRGPGAY